jgi:glycosyltransferase involved in cell wall biosynthesis
MELDVLGALSLNVLYLIHFAGQGGTERYVLSVAQNLRASGRINPFFAYTKDGLLRRRMESLDIPVFRIDMPDRYDLRAAKEIAKLCSENNIEVIHTQFLRENYLALLSKRYYKPPRVVYTNHLFFQNDLITRISNRILSRRQHAVIAVCNPAKEQMIQNDIPEKLIEVIHNGVDPDEWVRSAESAVRKETAAAEDTPVILYAARFVEDKGHAFLLDVLASIKDIPFHMLFAGDGDLLGDIKQKAETLGLSDRTTFLGFRDDIREVLSAADVCVNTASTEACSYNILEAMAMGVPQVVSDAGGNADLIDGENGLLFRNQDHTSLARALRRVLTDPALRARFSSNSKATAKSRFDLRDMLDKTFNIYQEERKSGS